MHCRKPSKQGKPPFGWLSCSPETKILMQMQKRGIPPCAAYKDCIFHQSDASYLHIIPATCLLKPNPALASGFWLQKLPDKGVPRSIESACPAVHAVGVSN